MTRAAEREETLLEVFEPPDGMCGHTAALVAMTAGEGFLDAAMERFTGLRARQRARLGRVMAYLMLDPHESETRTAVLRPGQVPGMHELQPRSVPIGSLLHAKVALLGFSRTRTGPIAHLRLLVLTANFTYTSARHQLEHVVAVDVPLGVSTDAADRLDVGAAASFVRTLIDRRFHREKPLTNGLDQLLAEAEAVAPRQGVPRFIHSLDEPLFKQIKKRFKRDTDVGRNILVCGSGFYEQPVPGASKPEILRQLEDLVPMTATATRLAVVEPMQAGAIAAWADRATDEGWQLRDPVDPLQLGRRLHAKFIYVGYRRDGHLSNGCAYVGSGNLSRRGLLTSGAMADGNIECGMVSSVTHRLDNDLTRALLFWDQEVGWRAESLAVGDVEDAPDEEQPNLIATPPVLSAVVVEGPSRALRLRWAEILSGPDDRVVLRWPGGPDVPLVRGQDLVGLGEAPTPTSLEVTDGTGTWPIPVIDPAGRVSWEPVGFETYEEALGALLDFPLRPAESDDDDDDGVSDDGSVVADGNDDDAAKGGSGRSSRTEPRTYALYAAAELIEQIAAFQRFLDDSLLDDWLDHLDRNLSAEFPASLLDTWRRHGLDVPAHLRDPALRPASMTPAQRNRYERILDRTAAAWGLR